LTFSRKGVLIGVYGPVVGLAASGLSLLDRAAHRASQVRLIHVSIRAAQRAATTAFMGQARPTDLRTMSCLGQANLCVPHAGPTDPACPCRFPIVWVKFFTGSCLLATPANALRCCQFATPLHPTPAPPLPGQASLTRMVHSLTASSTPIE
jgi:hypothetical protein